MTIQEAINHAKEVAKINRIRTKYKVLHNNDKDEINACLQCAKEHEQLAEWLEELQQYRAIGTVEECREARERQRAKKPLQGEPFSWIDSVKVGRRWKEVRKTSYGHACPNCGKSIAKLNGEYCSKCGQAIDWSDTD